jgi:hypothetical protein
MTPTPPSAVPSSVTWCSDPFTLTSTINSLGPLLAAFLDRQIRWALSIEISRSAAGMLLGELPPQSTTASKGHGHSLPLKTIVRFSSIRSCRAARPPPPVPPLGNHVRTSSRLNSFELVVCIHRCVALQLPFNLRLNFSFLKSYPTANIQNQLF